MNLPITLDFIQTVAFAGVVLFLGYGIRRLVPPLSRVNIPAQSAAAFRSPAFSLSLTRSDISQSRSTPRYRCRCRTRSLHRLDLPQAWRCSDAADRVVAGIGLHQVTLLSGMTCGDWTPKSFD